jgi:hypothetical protein
MEEQAAEGRAVPALETSLAMVDCVLAFIEPRMEGPAVASLPTLLARVGDLYSSARPVLGGQGGPSIKSFLAWFTKSADDQARGRQILRDATQGVQEVLKSAFSLLQAGFRSPAQGRQLAQTCDVFLGDLAKVLDKLEC